MCCRYNGQLTCPGRVKNKCAEGNRRRWRNLICGMGVLLSTNLARAATCRRLTALVAAARVLMPLMRGAGTVMLISGARRRRANGFSSGTEADAVYQQRQYRHY